MGFLGTQFLNTHEELDKAIFLFKIQYRELPALFKCLTNLNKAYNEKGDKIKETSCKKKVSDVKTKKMNLSKLIIITSLLLMFTANITFCQNTFGEDKKKINAIINTFMKCIKEKDTVSFNQLFAPDPVVWTGVYKPKSQLERVTKNNEFSNYFTGKYELFIKYLSAESRHEEKFYNIKIINDDAVGSVNFDYSFWENGVKQNWGKESWSMVKLDGKWKIAAVIFSMEMENVAKEPNQRRQ